MKKFLALLLCVFMLTSFVACGEEEKTNVSSTQVDNNTITVVNKAYTDTITALSKVKALGYSASFVKSSTVDDATVSNRIATTLNFLGEGEEKKYSYIATVNNGTISEEAQIYSDAKNIYAHKLGTTYLLSNNKETNEYAETLVKNIEIFDASKIKVNDTVIVNAAGGGHGFVLEYDFNDKAFNADEEFGAFIAKDKENDNFTVTGLRVSGIINQDGKITSQTVTYSYTYTVEVEVEIEDVDPDNESAETTKKVTKTVENQIVFEVNLNYDLVEIKAPNKIEVMTEDSKPYDEISLTEFQKLSSTNKDDDDK